MFLLISQLFYWDHRSYVSLQNHTAGRKETGNSNFGGRGSYGNVSNFSFPVPFRLSLCIRSIMKTINGLGLNF